MQYEDNLKAISNIFYYSGHVITKYDINTA